MCVNCWSHSSHEHSNSPPGRHKASSSPWGPATRAAVERGSTMIFGRLERSQGSAPMGEINMTPLIDVMLVLLVIFIITAPLMVSSVKMDLPKAAGGQNAAVPQFVAVSINRAGQVFVGDQALGDAALAQAFGQAAQRHADTEVQLRADTAVPYGRVVEVMGLAQKAGLNRIGFVADAPLAAAPTPR